MSTAETRQLVAGLMEERIEELLNAVPNEYTTSKRHRKSGNPVVRIKAKKPDPNDPYGGRKMFEIEGPHAIVIEGIRFWMQMEGMEVPS